MYAGNHVYSILVPSSEYLVKALIFTVQNSKENIKK